MQISRHWRMNAQRYRLQGIRHENGQVSLSARPTRDEVGQEYVENERMEHTSKHTSKVNAA